MISIIPSFPQASVSLDRLMVSPRKRVLYFGFFERGKNLSRKAVSKGRDVKYPPFTGGSLIITR